MHFDFPYWRTAQHYIGYTTIGLEKRMTLHRKGRGSKLVNYALKNGNNFEVVYTEEFETAFDARKRERKLKQGKNLRLLCVRCKESREAKKT